MKKIYATANTTEAHIIKGLLEQQGVTAQVSGHYLQGALGELPAIDLIAVFVADEQAGQALGLIEEYESGALRVSDEVLTQAALNAKSNDTEPEN